LFFVQNNCFLEGKLAICGTRGWICPGDRDFTAHDEKIYKRELMRLKSSLDGAVAAGAEVIIGALHFPPTNDKQQTSGFTECFSQYGVKMVVYGHLHGKDAYSNGIEANLNGTEYRLVSLDRLQCQPLLIWE
jgi:predicted phosphohydrolase